MCVVWIQEITSEQNNADERGHHVNTPTQTKSLLHSLKEAARYNGLNSLCFIVKMVASLELCLV